MWIWIKVKEFVYSQNNVVGSDEIYKLHPNTWTDSFTVSSPYWECSAIFYNCGHSHSTNFLSAWYPLLLCRQRRCGFKAWRKLLHMTRVAAIQFQTPAAGSRVHVLTTRPWAPHNKHTDGLCVLYDSQMWCLLNLHTGQIRWSHSAR